jgi:tRNA-splicing ligase RtcB
MKSETYEVIHDCGGQPIKMWTQGVPVEESARLQLANTARMPFIYKHIAVMPDVHLGKGSTIGSVVPTLGTVIPAAVGVDIGCGMMAAKTTLTANDLPDSLGRLRSAIERAIPDGMSPKTPGYRGRDEGSWNTGEQVRRFECGGRRTPGRSGHASAGIGPRRPLLYRTGVAARAHERRDHCPVPAG